eukprot:4738406-Heterocapsa_arctica.AAC.1
MAPWSAPNVEQRTCFCSRALRNVLPTFAENIGHPCRAAIDKIMRCLDKIMRCPVGVHALPAYSPTS